MEIAGLRGNAPTRRRLNLNFSGCLGDVGLHLQVDGFRGTVREQNGGLGPLQRHGRFHHNRTRQLALGALNITIGYGANHFDIFGFDPQVKMRFVKRRVLRQTDIELIGDGVRVALLGLHQPVGLR